jgi:hypothetical protein
MTKTPEERADELFELAKAKSDAGDEQAALALGIAATALREWRVARDAWRRAGIELEEGDAPISGKFGYTPVRLNGFEQTDAAVEVVWAHRLSPVTARISNIPTPQTGFLFGDVVLHDGAATGTRFYASGDERSVFNVFELFEPSDFMTFDVDLVAPDADAIKALESACETAAIEIEDWTRTIRLLCKACSEGRAHDKHDHSLESDEWQVRRRVGLASRDAAAVHTVLEKWSEQGKGRSVESVEPETIG